MWETWYVLEDGTNADPREVATDDNGVLRHKSGVAVKIGTHRNPVSRSVDVEQERAKAPTAAKGAGAGKPSAKDRQVKADKENDPEYKTR